MKRFLNGLSGVLLGVGLILTVGCAQALNLTGACIGLACMAIGAIVSNRLDKAGVFEEGDDDAEDD